MTTAVGPTSALAGDVREGGTWTRRQRIKNALLATAVRTLLVVLPPLPRPFLRALGRAIGLFALLAFGRARRTAAANLGQAFPALDAPEVRSLRARAYATLGAHLGDAVASLSLARPLEELPIDAESLALLDDERGVLFVSAHLGPWERVAATLAARGVPLTALAREAYDPRLAHVYARLRRASGLRVIYRGQRSAPTRIVRALRAGGVLGVPMDLRSRVPSVIAPFLERPAPTPVGPARIALRTGARVVVGTVAPRADGGLCITCTLVPTSDLAVERAAAEATLTARINAELSARIRALPSHWVWMHDRFAPEIP
jgi:KDO2-lipid IV(A) lauroyltransferase